MNGPLVSIIAPCYNAEKNVEKLLDSVLDQDYKPIEFIVINDGSTDNTLKILNSYKQKFKKNNIKYTVISQENGGLPNAINAGLSIFTGDYINLIDHDDYFTKNSISERVKYLERNPDDDVVWAETNIIDETTGTISEIWGDVHRPSRRSMFMDMLTQRDYVWVSASKMIRASAFLKLNPSRYILENVPGQNIQIFLPIYYRGDNVGYIDTPLANVLARSDSDSRRYRNEEETRKYQLGIRDTYIDTLSKMDIPSGELDEYIKIINNHFSIYEPEPRVFHKLSSNRDELGRLYEYDEYKFRNSYLSKLEVASQRQLAARLIFSSHSIEKSLSNDNFEIGHGLGVSKTLIDLLNVYNDKGYDKAHLSYINTLSVLKAYYEKHKDTKFITEIEDIFSDLKQEILDCKSLIGGVKKVFNTEKYDNENKNFKELSENRFGVRSYSSKNVDPLIIKEVVSIALKTPTVCNRQSLRVHSIYDKDIIRKVLEVQGGIKYYDTPPVLLLITADDAGYNGVNERNQGFVDGGLFAMSILYALEYKGLAACPLHAMFTEESEMMIRGMLNLHEGEKLITFISVGHFNEVSLVPKSFRYPVDDILSVVDRIGGYSIKEIENTIQKEEKSLLSKVRIRLRLRTRIRNLLNKMKQKVRLRTRIRKMGRITSELLDSIKFSRADGAIVTLNGYFNYGNILQRFALQEFLRKKGLRFVSYAQETFELNEPELTKYKYTSDFVRRKIWRKKFSKFDRYKVYITGSDQVWRNWSYENERNILGYFFLDFTRKFKANRIAYAVSIGKDSFKDANVSSDFIQYIKPVVKKLTSVSVRENTAVNLVKDTFDVTARHVVDPTMLLMAKDYDDIISESPVKLDEVGQIFTYVLRSDEAVNRLVDNISKATNMSLSDIYFNNLEVWPPVEQWLKCIKDAELVITDSFHGVVFSLINNTSFIVVESDEGGNARIKSLLDELGLSNRFIKSKDLDHFNINNTHPIDWVAVNDKVKARRKESGDWLLKSIKDQ